MRWRSRRARDFVFSLGVRPSGAAITALRGYLSVDIGGFLFSSPEHAVRKGRGDHPTEERNLGLEAVNPTPWAAISHLRAPEHPSLLALELPARLDDRSTLRQTAIYACICANRGTRSRSVKWVTQKKIVR